jgi:hypothetical protein
MQPSFDLRLRTMSKALSQTILPAIACDNSAAIEQAKILLGSIELIRQQVDHAHWVAVSDARDLAGLARKLLSISPLPSADAVEAAAAGALRQASRHDIPLSHLETANADVRAAISALIEEAFETLGPDALGEFQAAFLAGSEGPIGRERAFVAGAGFDVFPDSLCALGDLGRPGFAPPGAEFPDMLPGRDEGKP